MPSIRVLRLILVLLGGLVMQACASHPDWQPATTQGIQEGAELTAAQLEYIRNYNCPDGTRKRVFTEAENRIRSGRGGRTSTIVRVQCVDLQTGTGDVPPLARPATPLPVPHHAPSYPGHQIPYRNHDSGYRPPGWYWPGGGGYRSGSCWTGFQLLEGPCQFIGS